MSRYMLIILLLIVKPVLADQHCIKPKTDHQRGCADIGNVHNLPALAKAGDCAIIKLDSRSHWNASGLRLEKGYQYSFEVMPESDKWCDGEIGTDKNGWHITFAGKKSKSYACKDIENKPDMANHENLKKYCDQCKVSVFYKDQAVKLSMAENILVKSVDWLRRKPESELFALIGVVRGELYDAEFDISKLKETFSPAKDAEFCAYANDLSFMYGNNSGSLSLKITRGD